MVPGDVKDEVLNRLCESGVSFETVSDLCEMSARKDERLKQIFDSDAPIKIAACYPRAVKWLCHNAGITLPEDESVEVLNMREETGAEIADKLLGNSKES